MKVGKVSETVLKRSVLKQLQFHREEVIQGPGVGKDCALVCIEPSEILVLSTDPVTGTVYEIGELAVHVTVNDLAAGGAEPVGIMLSILLPEACFESELRDMMKQIEETCSRLGIQVLGGHTEVTAAVNWPVVTVTGVGKMKKKFLESFTGIRPGNMIIMTKSAGLEGTAILAREREKELLERYSVEFVESAKMMMKDVSVLKEAEIGRRFRVAAMHDITEGGVFGALWEMAAAGNVGLEIELMDIPLKQETVEICEVFDLNPYQLISSGSLLLATDRGYELVKEFARAGVPAVVIGRAVSGKGRVILNGEETRYLEPPRQDEIYKVLKERK
jgi:hydrogenase expression/formation protein HypE